MISKGSFEKICKLATMIVHHACIESQQQKQEQYEKPESRRNKKKSIEGDEKE